MAHKLVSGIDRMASSRTDTVWHRAETLADGRLTEVRATGDAEADVLSQAAVVWPTESDNDISRTIALVTSEGTPVTSHIATLSPSGRVLGIVTCGYEAVPFKTILTEWVLALARAGGIPETLGTFDAGRNFFASLQVAESWRIPGDSSDTRPLFNVVGNHTGEGGIRGSFASFRVVCANTSAMYQRDHDAVTDAAERASRAWVSVRHSANALERMREAVAWIIDGRSRAESERALMERLASKLISKAEVVSFTDRYISIPAGSTDRVVAGRQRERETFGGILRDSDDLGDHAWRAGNGITAYGLLQSVTRFEDWQSRTRDTDATPVATRRAFRAFLGTREAEKATARDHILELAGIGAGGR